ncbi:MAG: hypothetical protein KDB52_06605 [Solirubrobacterales bacterium]|nr:hypothetical protein [Solirubrobacterales bacterium]
MKEIRVATASSPRMQRVAWLVTGGLVCLVGLALVAITLSSVESLAGLAASMIIVIPGLLWVATGLNVILRVTGKKPEAPVGSAGVAAFTISAMVGVLGIFLMLAFWALSHSVWTNEGGTPETAPDDGLIYAGICFLISIICLVLAFTASRIDDPPRPERKSPRRSRST